MQKKLLTVVARIMAKPGKTEQVRSELQKLVAPTHAEQGCVQYDLHESNTKPGLFLFYENWDSQEDLARHLESPHLQALRSIEKEILAEPVDITLWSRI